MTTIERPPYIYGEIFSRSIYTQEHAVIPPIGRFLSQAMAAGACMTFFCVLLLILLDPSNHYNFLFIFVLPILLAGAMVFGLIEGLIIWGCTRLVQHRLNPAARAGIGLGVSVLFGIILLLYFWIVHISRYNPGPTFAQSLWSIGISLVSAESIGLVTSSRLQPWRELVRGASEIPNQSRVLTGITGLLLRVIVIFFLMETIIWTICTLQTNDRLRDAALVFITLGHVVAATLVVFARMKFWLLLPLALIINLPIAYFLNDAIKHQDLFLSNLTIFYLALWAAFLIARFKPTYQALAFLREELRYYLID